MKSQFDVLTSLQLLRLSFGLLFGVLCCVMVNLLKAWFETFGFDSRLSMNGKAVGTRNVRLAFYLMFCRTVLWLCVVCDKT